ncbi:MAG: amidohydrolase family protein [Thermoprotei archaeon]
MDNLVLRGSIFDGDEYFDEGVVVVNSSTGLIEACGRANEVEIPTNAQILGGNEVCIIPGLMDTHLHFFASKTHSLLEWVSVPETLAALRSVRDLRALLRAGFTTVRELGSKCATHLSKAVDEGVVEGPTIISSSKSLAQTGGDDDPLTLPLNVARELSYSYYCDGPWECRKAVRMVVRDGGRVVKVYASGSFAQGGRVRRQFTVEELRAIVDEAHASGLKVAAHAYGEEALTNAVEAGVDSIEHGIGLTEEIAYKMKEKGIFYVPTLSAYVGSENTGSYERRSLVQRHLKNDMEIAMNVGLKIVCGSDFVGSDRDPHGQNYREIVYLSERIGNRLALRAATSTAADCVGVNTGRIKQNTPADIVLVRGSPLQDIMAISPQRVLHVIKAGRIVF